MSVIKFIIVFALCSLVNVMFNTAKTIIMYRNEKFSSSLINAITYGFYTIVVVLMAGEMALWLKVIITAATNFVGVWLSMLILEHFRKDKLWKVEIAVEAADAPNVHKHLELNSIPHNYIEVGAWVMFNCYCMAQKDTTTAIEIAKQYNGKISAYENKL